MTDSLPTSDFLPDEVSEITRHSETGHKGQDGRTFTMLVKFKGEERYIEVSISGTAISMIDVEPEDAVAQFIDARLQQLDNDADWTEAVAGRVQQISSKDVENGIGINGGGEQ